MNLANFWRLLKEAGTAWSADKAPQMGAALAYYTAFSFAPLLLLAIGIASLVFGEEAARGGLLEKLEDTVGPLPAAAIESLLKNAHESGGGTGLTVVGVLTLLLGASGVFLQLQASFNTIWKVTDLPQRSGLLEWLRDRLFSIAAVLGTGFLLLVSLILSALVQAAGQYLTPASVPGGVAVWEGLNLLISFGFISFLFALLFKLLPDTAVTWRDVWLGAVLTAILFTLGKFLLGLYLGRSSVASTFGAAGSLVVVLVWVYYSSQIVLFGAEFSRAYAVLLGSRASAARGIADPMGKSLPTSGQG